MWDRVGMVEMVVACAEAGGLIQDGERKDTEATCWSETSGGCSVRIVLGTRPSLFLFLFFLSGEGLTRLN